MENETRELIEQLAEKLGTTTEYLWGVMINQAHIYAMTTILEIVGLLFIGVLLWKAHKKLSKPIEENDKYGSNLYDEYEELAGIPMVLGAIIWGILFIVSFFAVSHVITAILNPEYWALMQILDKC